MEYDAILLAKEAAKAQRCPRGPKRTRDDQNAFGGSESNEQPLRKLPSCIRKPPRFFTDNVDEVETNMVNTETSMLTDTSNTYTTRRPRRRR